MEIGDILTVEVPHGSFSYEIADTEIVDADDRTIIVSTAPDELLTISICYPFNYIGSAPDRYIITALPIEEN
jgi:sortase A